jgi:DNA-binding CsgD family transcriptional regulator
MGHRLLIQYEFLMFGVGIACMSALVLTARRDPLSPARPFLVLYGALTVLVATSLLPALFSVAREGGIAFALQYLESFVGRYGVMFALPYFVHRLFGVDRRHDRWILAITLVTAAAQHLTEYGFSGRLDEAGDVVEDVAFAGIMAYSIWVGISRRTRAGGPEPMAETFFVLSLLGIPGITYDLFFRSDAGWRFYPLWYALTSVVMTWQLTRRTSGPTVPEQWGLSTREGDVLRVLRRGLSNKAIARELDISPNTVKTHLQSVFDKSGIRTRVGLIAALSASDPHGGAEPEA